MDRITVPGSDLSVSRLVLGTMTFGAPVSQGDAASMLDLAEEAGITMLDTANGYAGGRSEEIIGALLAGRRERFTVASKVGIANPDAQGAAPLSPEAIERCVHASLRRLRTDYLDVYYLHQPDRQTPIERTLQALGKLVSDGTVRYIGVSNYAAWQIAELRAAAAALSAPAPVVSQPLYNLISRRLDDEYLEFSTHAELTNIVYNPLAGGVLTGRHRFDDVPEKGRFGDSAMGVRYRDRYWDRQLFDAVDELARVAAEAGLTLPELSLRWLLTRPGVGAVLVGASTLAHLRSNVESAAGGPLPSEVMARCDEVWQRLRGPAPVYNR
jgi:aryl-alcohol dehydrogenase-like predicted oxidoreductase